jgi:hypothetical protein
LIGLLFASIALRPDGIFGPDAPVGARAPARSNCTGLANAFSVMLLAIVPHDNVGHSAAVVAVICLINTVRLHKLLRHVEYIILLISSVAYLLQFGTGIDLVARPHGTSMIAKVCYLIFTSFAGALSRVWFLIQGNVSDTRDRLR